MSGAGTLVSPRETDARSRQGRASKFRPEIQGLRSLAGLLVVILRSDEVRGFLLNLIRTALALP